MYVLRIVEQGRERGDSYIKMKKSALEVLLYDIIDELNTLQNKVFIETKSLELVDEFKKIKKRIEMHRITQK